MRYIPPEKNKGILADVKIREVNMEYIATPT